MGRVIDELYGSNLGCDRPPDVFSLASQAIQIEQKLSDVQTTFPAALQLVEPEEFANGPDSSSAMLRFRVVHTLRYYNLKILIHRPILHRYLEVLNGQAEDVQRMAPPAQLGVNSLRICIQSASSIVELMSHLTESSGNARGLCGAWWFSLFYSKAPPG